MATLAIDSIDLYYGAAQALRGVSLTCETGKVTCVLGRNGVGKSSLLRAIMGVQPVARGTHHLEGRGARLTARPMTAPAAASPMCHRAAKSSRC